jgi:hypothetical protein
VSVDIALLSSRIERGIVAEFEGSLPVAAARTQASLDRSGPAPSPRLCHLGLKSGKFL